jgi:exonuclease SbcC
MHDLADLALDRIPDAADARDARAADLASWNERSCSMLEAEHGRLSSNADAAASAILGVASEHGVECDAADALTALDDAARGAAADRARAEESLEEDDAKAKVLNVLATELRANNFTDFIVQETLDLLAVHASDELRRISDGRYSLVSSDGNFAAIDHVNADETRSVKTLSGGETFMASLSLALALSKHVSELAGEGLGAQLETVFIDEGFGSLDPETLEEVIDALERLREDDLLVGVITHVPALAERIRSGLEIRKEGNRSVVVPVE